MALASINQSCKITGTSMQLYLYPYVAPTGTTLTAQLASLYSNIYTSGKTGTPTIPQWALLDSTGCNFKYKSDMISVDTNFLGKVPAGFGPPEITMEGVCVDINADHLKDILGATTNELVTETATSTLYGSLAVAMGSQRRVAYYGAIVRWLSPTVVTGTDVAWDHLVIPRLVINPELDLKFNRKDPTVAKFNFMIIPDATILSADSGGAVSAIYDTATTPSTT